MVTLQEAHIVVVGGGAAGFFAAIHAAERHPNKRIVILESSKHVLSKVLISGGGRCNVTSATFKPNELIKHYPRGHQYLLKPFQQYNSADSQNWFKAQGVRLKTEPDGRVFPITDNSQTIVDALVQRAKALQIDIRTSNRVKAFEKKGGHWLVETVGQALQCHKLIIACGGNKQLWKQMAALGLDVVSPVPSLFTFKSDADLLNELAGISFPSARVWLEGSKLQHQGPILITHEGVSGPSILKLSAWAARELHALEYKANIHINWLGLQATDVREAIVQAQQNQPKKHVLKTPLLDVPKRFWKQACSQVGIPENRNYAEIGKKQINPLIELLTNSVVHAHGKSTNKDEFVTAGGVNLEEMNLDTFEVKSHSGLYIVGEALNIDAVTGGFNFQGAWTTGYLAGSNV